MHMCLFMHAACILLLSSKLYSYKNDLYVQLPTHTHIYIYIYAAGYIDVIYKF